MTKKQKQQPNHADQVARRAFIRKVAVGAVFALPAVESLTKSDLLVKSALAATVPTWVVLADMFTESLGSVSPASQTVPNGGTASIQVTPNPMAMVTGFQYRIDGGLMWEMGMSFAGGGGIIKLNNVTANHQVDVMFLT